MDKSTLSESDICDLFISPAIQRARPAANLTEAAATRNRLLDALLAEALAPALDRALEAAE
jgi:hypothetical protein